MEKLCWLFIYKLISLFFPLHFQGEEEVEMSSTELLYQGILPSLPQYMVSLLCGSIYTKLTGFYIWLNISLTSFAIKATSTCI